MFHRRGMLALAKLPILIGAVSAQTALALVPATGLNPAGEETAVTVVPDAAQPRLSADLTISDDTISIPAATATPAVEMAASGANDLDAREVECMAKVIVHEAGREPARGQIAVAQVIRARMRAGGRFGETACAVIKQPGQFFNVDAYNPARDTAQWTNAVAIARDTLNGGGEEVAPGALFFHSAASHGRWVAARARVTQIGMQVFYR